MQLTVLQAAQLLIANERLAEARTLLDRYIAANPDDSQGQFLRGMVAVGEKDYDTAIQLFRRILVREPEAERVRLELGRAFFLKKDYDNADRQFRFARAGNIGDAVKANIDQYLGAINALREWSFHFAFALAPDTNQNAATASSQIDIFGIPFLLDKSARRQSGIGLSGEMGGEWSPLLDDNIKARIGAELARTEYSGGDFDDMTLSGYAGPQFLFSNWNLSLLASGFERWYGNQSYVSGLGGRVAAEYGITSDLMLGASFGGQAVSNTFIPEQSGPLFSIQLQGTYVLSPSSLFQLQLGFSRQEAEIAPYSYTGVWLGGGYQQDLPWGFTAAVQPSYAITRYDAALPAFGQTRSDDTMVLGISLLNRRWDYHGFTPRFSYVFTEQHSNIALYSFTRSQFQIGVTSLF
ncbi:MAG TPA: surface lipoprotein assembly modifier [Rhizomicrobium sp.]|nr:surface lipoprotein assembly modifier [Rhizomicrobium sp.]